MAKHPNGRVEVGRAEREDELDDGVEVEESVIDPDHPACPRCGWHNTRLSHTKTIVDSMLKYFSVRAFRCRSCGNRFHVMRRVNRA